VYTAPLSDQIAAVIDNELHLTCRTVQHCHGQIGVAQSRHRHGLGVDRIGLSGLATATTHTRH
jgi:hypothetical protein